MGQNLKSGAVDLWRIAAADRFASCTVEVPGRQIAIVPGIWFAWSTRPQIWSLDRLRLPLLRQPIEQVLRDPHDVRVIAAQAVGPVGRAASKDGAPFGVESHHRSARTVFGKAFVPQAVVRMPPRRARSQDEKVFGRAVATGGRGQSAV